MKTPLFAINDPVWVLGSSLSGEITGTLAAAHLEVPLYRVRLADGCKILVPEDQLTPADNVFEFGRGRVAPGQSRAFPHRSLAELGDIQSPLAPIIA